MRTQKTFSASNRRRQMQRHTHKMVNRRHTQFIQTINMEKKEAEQL